MSRHLRIGVALGGGGARGLAHIARAWARSSELPMRRVCARAISGNMRR